jgi:3-deoxy-D-manno-octulosonic-acid transferase
LSTLIYNISTGVYSSAIRLASFWNKKAALWVTGRRDIFTRLNTWKKSLALTDKIVWMHCASLGEFEQGRPVAEAIKKKYPGHKLLITFFSPSGYEVRKSYEGADAVFYLPEDSEKNAGQFINIIDPALVIWVKYEYWFHYLTRLKQRNTPVILVSAIFRESQPFFKWYGGLWKKMLGSFERIFVQNDASLQLLQNFSLASNAVAAGDTRFDRVIEIAESNAALPDHLLKFAAGFKVIVAGSTWEEDEEEIVHYAKMHPQIKFIIAPHEIDEQRLKDVLQLFPRSILYSTFTGQETEIQIVIIDNIGMLSKLYRMATIAYVGGGFNSSGIHNILEAAVYEMPVIFGPEYEKFKEANDLVETGGAFSIDNALELEHLLDKLLSDETFYNNASSISKKYVQENAGATAAVMNYIYEKRLLTN